ncbi:MAG: Mlc titration factor MtfA (ptsG expression regulator) [Saprospiraceae bacterium]|jgi:Mlc titration factor MtfA (ptsG expression regulator)
MLSRILIIPLAIIALICLYLAWENQLSPIYIVPCVVMAAIILIFSPQIDWWWAVRNPPPVDPMLEGFLRKFFPYYTQLSLSDKKYFMDRVSLYLIATEFIPMVMEHVPEDIKGMIAANVVMLTFGQEDYRLAQFEKIVLYPHPFPSPQYREIVHSTEHFEEDGVLLFSLEQLIPGITQKTKYYNIALHEYAKIFMLLNKDLPYPKFDDSIWENLSQISGFNTATVKNYIGLPVMEPLPVSINYFFTFPQKFQQVLPDIYDTYSRIFNQNPVNGNTPVVDVRKQRKQKVKG